MNDRLPVTNKSAASRHIECAVSDVTLVGLRRAQVLRAAIKLFSASGYYTTTIRQIADEANVSVGLVYQYFGDKDDILFLSLKLVLETYETEIPLHLEGVTHPVERLAVAVSSYCTIVDRLREATVLAYRSTKSLRKDRRHLIKDLESRTNRLFKSCVRACVAGAYMREVNQDLLVYQYVMFSHAWALKRWAFPASMTCAEYVTEGVGLLIAPFLTEKGLLALEEIRRRVPDAKDKKPAHQ